MARLLARLPWLLAAIGAAGVAFAAYEAITWPDVERLARHRPRTTAFIERYKERRRDAGKKPGVAWRWAGYEQISGNLKRAVVSGEDLNFFWHNGFEPFEMFQAVSRAIEEGELPRGASTLTQQLAKNLYLSPWRHPLRKAKEAVLTAQLEQELTKKRILELYLNVVEFGPGIYGAEAAAQAYFGTSAASLTEQQAAQLAASLPRPSTWNPRSKSEAYRRYVETILARMNKAEFLKKRI